MVVIGWCRVCRKIKPVRVTGYWRTPVPEGICRQCEDDKPDR